MRTTNSKDKFWIAALALIILAAVCISFLNGNEMLAAGSVAALLIYGLVVALWHQLTSKSRDVKKSQKALAQLPHRKERGQFNNLLGRLHHALGDAIESGELKDLGLTVEVVGDDRKPLERVFRIRQSGQDCLMLHLKGNTLMVNSVSDPDSRVWFNDFESVQSVREEKIMRLIGFLKELFAKGTFGT